MKMHTNWLHPALQHGIAQVGHDFLHRKLREHGVQALFDLLPAAAVTTAAGEDCLQLVFTNLDWANLGDTAGPQASATAGTILLALHTASLSVGSTQATNEITVTGYARQAIARSGAGFTVSGLSAVNAALVEFGEASSGSETASEISAGNGVSDGLLFFGALDTNVAYAAPVNPRFEIGGLDFTVA